MQALDSDYSVFDRRLRYLEWVGIGFAGCTQLAWNSAAVEFDNLIATSYGLLVVILAVSLIRTKTAEQRFLRLMSQALLVNIASALGAHYFYYIILFALAAEASVFLPKKQLIILAATILVGHIASGQFLHYAMRHIHKHRHPVPAFYRDGLIEADSYLFFVASLVTVSFLGRKLISERQGRLKEVALQEEVQALEIKLDRERIARDMHDGLGHSLTSSKIQLELALRAIDEQDQENALEFLKRTQATTASALQEVRLAVKTAQHGVLSLKQSILMLVDEIKQQSDLAIKVELDDLSLPSKKQHQVFSIVKEFLTNVRKHSSATLVELTLKHGGGNAELICSDNGKGFDPGAVSAGFGLQGLKERAEAIGADLEIESSPGKGTRLKLHLRTADSG